MFGGALWRALNQKAVLGPVPVSGYAKSGKPPTQRLIFLSASPVRRSDSEGDSQKKSAQ